MYVSRIFMVVFFHCMGFLMLLAQESTLEKIDRELEKEAIKNSHNQWEALAEGSSEGLEGVGVTFPSIQYEFKIAQMNASTPIELDFNQRIEENIYNYAVKRKNDFSSILGLSGYYFPIFEELLDQYNLPLELKYLAVIESGLNPLAVSKSAAVGLWQFKLNSGKMFGLKINSFVDERRDPYKSTEAACKYLSYLYRVFNDWQLVISAYNGGPGEIREAIYRSGGQTKLDNLISYFPEQTKNYFAAFVAAS